MISTGELVSFKFLTSRQMSRVNSVPAGKCPDYLSKGNCGG